mgnify:CR=1 FL=1
MPLKNLVCLFIVLFSLCFTAAGVIASVPEAKNPHLLQGERQVIQQGVHWIIDDSGTLSLDEVRNLELDQFSSSTGNINLGFVLNPVWIRIDLNQPDSNGRWLLELTNPLFDDITLYWTDIHGNLKIARSGEDVPRSEWGLNYLNPVFLVELGPGLQQLYLRIEARNSLATELHVWRESAFFTASQKQTLFYGLYFGVFVLLIVFHGLFLHRMRDRQNAWLLAYLLAHGTAIVLTVGIPQLLFEIPGAVSDTLLGLAICAVLGITTQFVLLQLGIEEQYPRWSRGMIIGAWVIASLGATAILAQFYGPGVSIAQIAILVMYALLVLLTLAAIRAGHSPPFLLLLAFGVYFAGIAIRFLRNLGVLEATVLTSHSYLGAALLHIVLLSLGITRFYNRIQREKRQAQENALKATRQLNTSLETQVQERTRSLSDEIVQRKTVETELRLALEREQAAMKEQADFVTMVSHEFRTPLAIIDTTLQQLENNQNAPREKTRQRIHQAEKGVSRMVSLIDRYLLLDRVQILDRALDISRFKFEPWARNIVSEWPAGRVQLKMDAVPESFYADANLLGIAVRNLLANADRHSPTDSTIELCLTGTANGAVILKVADEGDGIARDELNTLFNKYFRGRTALNSPGAGLGLYLVNKIVAMHKGKVTVHSQPGEGSEFLLEIPRLVSRNAPA